MTSKTDSEGVSRFNYS